MIDKSLEDMNEVPTNRAVVWVIWFLASLFYAYQYILRVMPNIVMPQIMERFHVDAAQYGQFSGIYYIGYAGLQIPVGILLDRFGPKKIMPLCILLTIIGALPLIYTDIWIFPFLGRFLIGVGSCGAILGLFKIIRMGFPQHFSRMLGISASIGLLGAIYGGRPVAYLLKIWGWESTFHFILFIGIFLAFLIFIFSPSISSRQSKDSKGILEDLKTVFTHRKVIPICLLGGLMVGPLEGFADVWGSGFLNKVYNLDLSSASTLTSLIFFGFGFGAPLLSWFGDKTKAYFEIVLGCALFMGISFIVLLSGYLHINAIGILLVLIGIASSYQIFIISQSGGLVPEHLVSLTTALANMIIMIFGYVFHSLIGKTMDLLWNGQMDGSVKIYSQSAFQFSLAVIPVGLFIGALGFFIKVYQQRRAKLSV